MKKYISLLKQSQTVKYSSITFLGTVINGILGALFYIYIARNLGLYNFGLVVIVITLLTLIADVADLGTNSAIIKFVSHHFDKDREKALVFLRTSLLIKVLTSVTILALGWIIAPTIAEKIFNKIELINSLKLGFLGVLSAQLFSFSLAYAQALKKFWFWSGIQISTNLLRLLVVVTLVLLNNLNTQTVLISYVSIPMLGFMISIPLFPADFLKVKITRGVNKQIFDFSKWISITLLLSAISSRLDTLISGRLLNATQVGIYSTASQLVVGVPQIMRAIEAVIAPKMASFQTESQMFQYLKSSLLFVVGISTVGLISIPIGFVLIPFVYGNSYSEHTPLLFSILLVANLIFLITVPLSSAITYFYSYTKLFTIISFVNLVVISIVGWLLISMYGIYGAAFTVLIGMISSFCIQSVYLIRKLRK